MKPCVFSSNLPRGFDKKRLRAARRRRRLQGLVDIHHVVPRQFRAHPAVRRAEYDVEAGYNLLFCATSRGADVLHLRATRPLHDRHHHEYNCIVRSRLDACENHGAFVLLLLLLHRACRGRAPLLWPR